LSSSPLDILLAHVPISHSCVLLFSLVDRPPSSTLFPYTTLFRSVSYGPPTFAFASREYDATASITESGTCVPPGPSKKAIGCARDRKSTRLNSSHRTISYAVFCLKKKKNLQYTRQRQPRPQHDQN